MPACPRPRRLARLGAAASLWLGLTAAAPQVREIEALLDAPELVDVSVILLGLDSVDRMTVPVSVAGSVTYPFVVDTGSERTVVSTELARALRLREGPNVRVLSMAGQSTAPSVHIPTLAVSGVSRAGLVAPAFAGRHLGAAGLIGLDALQGKRVLLDFDRGEMRVEPASVREQRWDGDTIVIRARSTYGQLVLADATMNGERVHVILDTGSQVSVGNLALRRRLARRGSVPIELTSVTGESLRAESAPLGTITIGSAVIANLPVAFTDAAPFHRFGLANRPAMMLGMDALRLFRRVSVDFQARRVRLEARDHIGRPAQMFTSRMGMLSRIRSASRD